GASASAVFSGLSPAPVSAGGILGVLPRSTSTTDGQLANPLRVSQSNDGRTVDTLRCVLGPRDNWFSDNIQQSLDTEWTVSSHSNRVGLRLDSDTTVERVLDGELPSEGMVAGSVQIPPNGKPRSEEHTSELQSRFDL